MKKYRLITIGLILTSLTILSCGNKSENPDLPGYEATVIQEVENAVWAFHSADTARNATAVVNLMWPECNMLIDGKRMAYEDLAAGSRAFMPSLDVFDTEWTDLQVIPISSTSAISSFLFRDSIVTKEGAVIQSKGPNTFLWQKRGDEWRVLYGDADHYPID